ncbi:MAG: Mur ligase domain-containing protein [Opitutaceae bacterium]|jgi:UDP-N-acetylmuramyl pentapeptide synthase|nr:Mur ligase domain-containing protein [Opitutaceae bacterium]
MGFTQDTRNIRRGEIFITLRTARRDGHDFLPDALAAGAAAAIVSRPNPGIKLPQLVVADPLAAFQKIAARHRRFFQDEGGIVIAISGSCGKTSTKNLLAGILCAAHGPDRVLATEGNLNNHIGVPLTLTRIDVGRHKYAVIEAGISAPGEMETLAAMIAPDHAIITLIAAAHTQDLGDLEGVAREKAILLRHVRNDGARIFPKNCLAHPAFNALPASTPVDAPPPSALQPFSPSALSPSAGMAQNAALATHLATRLGVSKTQIQTALASWKPAKWRGELVRDPAGRLFYLDLYNANPASMADALDAFTRIAPPHMPRLYIIGGMEELGPDSPRHHRELGGKLATLLRDRPGDEVILIGARAPDIAAGIPLARPRIEILDTAAGAAPRITSFHGAIFMKGSRRCALETALPAGMEDTHL